MFEYTLFIGLLYFRDSFMRNGVIYLYTDNIMDCYFAWLKNIGPSFTTVVHCRLHGISYEFKK